MQPAYMTVFYKDLYDFSLPRIDVTGKSEIFGNSFKAIVKVRFEKKSSVNLAKRQAGKHGRKNVDFKASHLRAKKPKRCCALHNIF